MVKKWGKVFIFHRIIPEHDTFKEVKLKNLHSLACLNLNYCTTKQKPKIVEFIKTCNQYPCKFNFGHFFSSFFHFFCLGEMGIISSCQEW